MAREPATETLYQLDSRCSTACVPCRFLHLVLDDAFSVVERTSLPHCNEGKQAAPKTGYGKHNSVHSHSDEVPISSHWKSWLILPDASQYGGFCQVIKPSTFQNKNQMRRFRKANVPVPPCHVFSNRTLFFPSFIFFFVAMQHSNVGKNAAALYPQVPLSLK